jgi:hypothetical protein
MAFSIFPDMESAAGVIYRDAAGNPTSPPDVHNAYPPAPQFISTCEITALPSTCDARIEPRQINAIVSELLSFAECMNPAGPWDCNSLQNLCSSFNVWKLTLDKEQMPPVHVGETPPLTSQQGDLWYESDTGVLWMWYDDGNTTQWVQVNGITTIGGAGGGGGSTDGYTKTESDAKFMPYSGGGFIGNVWWGPTGTSFLDSLTGGIVLSDILKINMFSPNVLLQKTSSGGISSIIGQNGSQKRWSLMLGDEVAESGSNGGSNFKINRYNNDGTLGGTCLGIDRGTGQLNYFGKIVFGNGTLPTDNGVTSTGVIQSTAADGVSIKTIPGTRAAFTCEIDGLKKWSAGVGVDNTYRIIDETAGRIILELPFSGANALRGDLTITGKGFQPGGGTWTDSSDSRIKNVEGDYTRGLEAIVALHPVTYTFKGNDTLDVPNGQEMPYKNSPHHAVADGATKFTGLIAQEVESVIPEMVKLRDGYIDGNPVTDLRDLDTTPLIYALINSIKELKAEVDALKLQVGSAK